MPDTSARLLEECARPRVPRTRRKDDLKEERGIGFIPDAGARLTRSVQRADTTPAISYGSGAPPVTPRVSPLT